MTLREALTRRIIESAEDRTSGFLSDGTVFETSLEDPSIEFEGSIDVHHLVSEVLATIEEVGL